MFIERSTARIRGVRTLFVLVGAMPCAVLVAWAVIRHAPAHRDALCRQVEHVLGMVDAYVQGYSPGQERRTATRSLQVGPGGFSVHGAF